MHRLSDWMGPSEAMFVDLNAPHTSAMKKILDNLTTDMPAQD
jgi:hypothetical protein